MAKLRPAPNRKPSLSSTKQLRSRAEILIEGTARKISDLPAADMRALVHELHVHQLELEMQNEELRRVQLELETSRDRFSTLYDFSPVGYLTFNPAGEVREANLTVAKQLGVNRRDLIGKKLAGFLVPEARDAFLFHQQQLAKSGARHSCELKFRRAGGGFIGRLESICLEDQQFGGHYYIAVLSDITEQLYAEAARAHLAAIVESSSDAVISRSLDGIITSWNAGAERMFGYSSEQVMGTHFSLLIPIELREESPKIPRQIERGEQIGHYETVYLTKDGRRVMASVTASPIKDNRGRILGVSKIVRDVTQEHAAEEALRQSERNLVDFFNEAPVGLMWVRRDGRVLKMNRTQLELIGCQSNAEVANRPLSQFLADAEMVEDLLERLGNQETISNYRGRFRSRSGSVRHVLIDANGLWKDRRLVHSRWFVRDITRRMELEREILAISDREQRRIGQDLHDELGQQLAGVEFLAQSLTSQLRTVSKSAAVQGGEIARMVRRAMVHARELAHGLSPIGLETDGLTVALRDLAARTRKIFRIDCRFQCKSPVLLREPSVGMHLYRIAQEAVNNAIKHGKASRIDIGLTVNKSRIVLAVCDNGIGLPKKPGKQKGMGLRIMQYRAGMIGGSLLAQRQANGGMAFVCTVKDYLSPPEKETHDENP